MYGLSRIKRMTVRERFMAAAGVVMVCAALLAAGRGLAFGAVGEILRVRFGGDAPTRQIDTPQSVHSTETHRVWLAGG